MIKNNLKFNILKKILNKRMAVITNYSKLEYYYGEVSQIIDEDKVLIKNDHGYENEVSIFDLRNPAQEF